MNMLDNTEFVSKVGKRRLKSLVIPERKKKRCIDSAIELLEADESSESKKSFECPNCAEMICKPYPKKVKALISKIETNRRNYEQEQRDIYEKNTAELRNEGKPIPPFVFVPPGMSKNDRKVFCRVHRTELEFKPMAKERNYPENINFEDIKNRITLFEADLKSIANREKPSKYLDNALKRFKELGTNARKANEVMKVFKEFLPGYYGNKGLEYIMDALHDLFLQTGIVTKESADPLSPVEFLQQILVPECGIRLIQQDRNNEITLEEAAIIMKESEEYGSIVYFNTKKSKSSSQDISSQ